MCGVAKPIAIRKGPKAAKLHLKSIVRLQSSWHVSGPGAEVRNFIRFSVTFQGSNHVSRQARPGGPFGLSSNHGHQRHPNTVLDAYGFYTQMKSPAIVCLQRRMVLLLGDYYDPGHVAVQ